MQVRKFEAKSMKEALELVKKNLGPDAIILSARENQSRFGLAGEQSVEVTAAVSELTLRKKQLAEQKLSKEAREKYNASPARMQKQFIEKAYTQTIKEAEPRRSLTSRQYIDIEDDRDDSELMHLLSQGQRQEAQQHRPPAQDNNQALSAGQNAAKRIKSATQDALRAFQEVNDAPKPKPVAQVPVAQDQQRIMLLQNEIMQLRQVIESFQKVPQSFVQSHPGAEDGIPYELSFMYEKLQDVGISKRNITELLKLAKKTIPKESWSKKAFVDAWVIKHIMDKVAIANHSYTSKYQIFVGPSGQGKTSSLVKFASQMVIREKKNIAIVTSDLHKVGASEQLKIFAQILNVPFIKVKSKKDWEVISARLGHIDHFLMDTPGMNLRTVVELDTLRNVLPAQLDSCGIHYVQSVIAKDEHAFEVADRYKVIGFNDVIFNRLDDTAHHGLIYNFIKKFEVPIHSFGIGPQIPEDFEYATKERVVDLLFQLSKLRRERG